MEHCADGCEAPCARGQAPWHGEDHDEWDEECGLDSEADQNQLAQGDGRAEDFCERVTERGEDAKAEHLGNAEEGSVWCHAQRGRAVDCEWQASC